MIGLQGTPFLWLGDCSLADDGWISVGSRATHYDLDSLGIESQWERDFPCLSRLDQRPTYLPAQWVLGVSCWCSGQGVVLITHPFLLPWLWMVWSYTSASPLCQQTHVMEWPLSLVWQVPNHADRCLATSLGGENIFERGERSILKTNVCIYLNVKLQSVSTQFDPLQKTFYNND